MNGSPSTRIAAFALAAGLALSGCATSGGSKMAFSSENDGKPLAAAALIAALQGGLVGTIQDAALRDYDRTAAIAAEYRALETATAGTPVEWKGRRGVTGEVVAAQPYQVGSQNCRQFSQTVKTDSGPRTAYGTACRNVDGSWSLLS